jgi:hypothetical protein
MTCVVPPCLAVVREDGFVKFYILMNIKSNFFSWKKKKNKHINK